MGTQLKLGILFFHISVPKGISFDQLRTGEPRCPASNAGCPGPDLTMGTQRLNGAERYSGRSALRHVPCPMRRANIGGPCWNRTSDSLLKRQILYLTELTARKTILSKHLIFTCQQKIEVFEKHPLLPHFGVGHKS